MLKQAWVLQVALVSVKCCVRTSREGRVLSQTKALARTLQIVHLTLCCVHIVVAAVVDWSIFKAAFSPASCHASLLLTV